jgi:hypothetical protein
MIRPRNREIPFRRDYEHVICDECGVSLVRKWDSQLRDKKWLGTPNDIHKEVEGIADCLQEREISRNI